MRVVVQRVKAAHVRVDNEVVGEIDHGLVALVGVAADDDEATVEWMARKVANLRIFSDQEGRFDRSVCDVGGGVLSVSQFTLLGDTRKGTRPSFTRAAAPDVAKRLWDTFNDELRTCGVSVATGVFRANMQVSLTNDGPVTIVLDR